MSMFYCIGCQQYRDSDHHGLNDGPTGQYCEDCYAEKTTEIELEKIAEQVDGNSLEIIEMDKRVKKLEGGKKEWKK